MRKLVVSLLAVMLLVLGGCSSNEGNDNQDQLARIQSAGVMIVGTEGTYSPNSYHDDNGDLVGFDVDVARAIGEYLGVEVEFFEAEWDSLFAAMDSGRVDTVINEVQYTEERAEKYDFSDPYTYVRGALMVRGDNSDINGFSDLAGRRCSQNLTSTWGALAQENGCELVSIDSVYQSVELLNSGRADATLNAETAFADYLKNNPDADVKIVAYTDETTSSYVPTIKGETRLREAINEALAKMQESGELQEISERYFGIDVTGQR